MSVLTAERAAGAPLFLSTSATVERDRATGWHPHFGEVGGLSLADWKRRLGAPPAIRHSIVLATEERSGSEWLCQLLAGTNRLGRPSEYLNGAWVRTFIADYPDRIEEQVPLAHHAGTTTNGVFAMKLHTWHFDRLSEAMRLTDVFPNPMFVRLTRRDRLRQAISLVRARQTNSYHAHTAKAAEEVYDADDIARTLKDVIRLSSRWDAYFARNGIDPLRIEYEQLEADPVGVMQQIARLVGEQIRPVDLEISRPLKVQRDSVTEAWRSRFLAQIADLNTLD